MKSIELATAIGLPATDAMLSINFLPNAVYEPRACIRLTLVTAERLSFPTDRLIFEFTENEALDAEHVSRIVTEYRAMGFKTALDDFGSGHAGLGLLARIQPDIVKLDMEIIRGIDSDSRKQVIVRSTLQMLADLGIIPICEGVETRRELETLRDMGVDLIQGYVLAKPAFEALAEPNL
ncbi:EAL domain-containing protein [Hyphomicrobium sp. DMF-1]|uniref:EAL domain-containing protein n=1 Tax=Hyphomicrobium sp. DMF-1 TaxID=3019544 RepID=UPI002FDBE03D